MKKILMFFTVIPAMLIVISCTSTPKENTNKAARKTDISEFLGQWTIDIEGGSVGWLEVRQEDGYLDADVMWEGGSVLPVSGVFLSRDQVLIIQRSNDIVRKRDANNNPIKTQTVTDWMEITKNGDKINGILLSPRRNSLSVDTTTFIGTKLPPVPPAPDLASLKYGTPVSLFNGKDLTGWRLINEKQTNGFKVVDGALVNDPVQTEGAPHISYGNLRTDQEFEDFNLKLEVNVPPGNNSGVYLRGMYEIQVVDSYKKELDSHNMGAVYSRIRPAVAAEKPAGEWQTLDITLCKRHATVILNGVKIIDNQPIYGPTGGAIKSDVFSAGPIYLQGDHGKVSYRNILLTPIVY
jgi:3-keto-disaccharide hydrolase